MVLVAVLVFLILRQIMPIAAGLAGGVALNSFGMVSRSLSGGLQQGRAVYRKAVKLAAAPGAARSGGSRRRPGSESARLTMGANAPRKVNHATDHYVYSCCSRPARRMTCAATVECSESIELPRMRRPPHRRRRQRRRGEAVNECETRSLTGISAKPSRGTRTGSSNSGAVHERHGGSPRRDGSVRLPPRYRWSCSCR